MSLPLSLLHNSKKNIYIYIYLSRNPSTFAIPILTFKFYPNTSGKALQGSSNDLYNPYPFPPFPNQSYLFNPRTPGPAGVRHHCAFLKKREVIAGVRKGCSITGVDKNDGSGEDCGVRGGKFNDCFVNIP